LEKYIRYNIQKKRLFGFNFVSLDSFDKVIAEIENYNYSNLSLPIVSTPNIDQIVKLDRNQELKEMICNSFLILPDGQPIIWLSIVFNKRLHLRLSGSDLFPPLWERVKQREDRVLFIVSTIEIREILKKEDNKALFYVTPYFNIDDEVYNSIVDDIDKIIKRYSPKYTIIGLPFNKRERLVQSLLKKNNKKTLYILLGASLEFYTKIKKRAPIWVQKVGLEWFYRFLGEPRRLFKRYFIDSWYMIVVIFKEIGKRDEY
jgi:N-acetylglucosaminyldiphosphoundecaprenol N-acetyl-beta-D-mannosaminyltransferase